MWTYWWTDVKPPWVPFSWNWLWIEATCSGGDGSGDTDKLCQESSGNNPTRICPLNTDDAPPVAVTGNSGRYTKVTFCKAFFNQKGLQEMTDAMQGETEESKRLDLQRWDNKAASFLHEVTHMDYFMNVPGYGPVIRDWQYKYHGNWHDAYGVRGAKMIGKFDHNNVPGLHSQTNAENLALFALAKWVELYGKDRRYPHLPALDEGEVPSTPPRPGNRDVVETSSGPPVCPAAGQPPSPPLPQCSEESSDVDSKLFGDPSGETQPLFDSFCSSVDTTQPKNSTVDSHGNSVQSGLEKSPPPNPDVYKGYTFDFSFRPADADDKTNCKISCQDGLASFKDYCGNNPGRYSPAFRQTQGSSADQPQTPGGIYQQTNMAMEASIEVGCGTYAYTIHKPPIQAPPPGTDCKTDDDCKEFGCEAGEHISCMQSSPATGPSCQCSAD
ncbi:GDSL-like lipase/acylhydrolase [Apiospora rasikravindrae]|uniref:GDSL-like lipase/acylhydrolase n=1 Tax=Apiospora rasikravindrae TaxID=990691 RepID=A0ABR1U7F9_9PEZI